MSLAPPRAPLRKPVRVTTDLWWHCFECCGIAVILVALAAWTLPGRATRLTVITLAVVTVTAWAVTWHATRSAVLASWLLAWGAFLAGWFAAARAIGVWTQDVLAALVIGFAVLFATGPSAIAHYRTPHHRDPDADERERQQAERGKWEARFARWGMRGVRVTAIGMHAEGAEVHGLLSAASDEQGIITFDRLKSHADDIVTDLQIAPGAVSFTQPDPDNAAAFVMHLRTRKGSRKMAYLPVRAKWRSVNQQIELGIHDSGRKFRMLFREIAVMIVGVRGAGKSNVLGVVIGELAWCEDALIFGIDLKGGRILRPFMMPWIEDPDGIRRPVIDWMATTRAEAKLMLETLIAAGDARALAGHGAEKITPSRKRPAVVLILDESAVATAHRRRDEGITASEMAVLIARLAETYRSEAIDPWISATRGDVETMGLSAIKAQALCRIGMKVGSSGDGDRIFQDDHAAAAALTRITDKGVGLVQLDGRVSEPVHFYRITPKLAYAIAKATGPRRPQPDAHLEAAMGAAYADRWQRMESLLASWRATAAEWKEDAGISDDGPAVTGDAGGGDEDDTERQFREIISRIGDPEDVRGRKDPARRRMRGLLRQAGQGGMRVGDLQKQLAAEAALEGSPELAVHRNTLHKWLKDDEVSGLVRHAGKLRDPYGRWIWIRQESDDGPDLGPPGGEEDLL